MSVSVYFRLSSHKASRLSAVRCATNSGYGYLHQKSTFQGAFVLPVGKNNRVFIRSQQFVAIYQSNLHERNTIAERSVDVADVPLPVKAHQPHILVPNFTNDARLCAFEVRYRLFRLFL
jgi:hypothetical protein